MYTSASATADLLNSQDSNLGDGHYRSLPLACARISFINVLVPHDGIRTISKSSPILTPYLSGVERMEPHESFCLAFLIWERRMALSMSARSVGPLLMFWTVNNAK